MQKLAQALEAKSKFEPDLCPYCGDKMELSTWIDKDMDVWVAAYVCTNVDCGAVSPKSWNKKRKNALVELRNKAAKRKPHNLSYVAKNVSRAFNEMYISYDEALKNLNKTHWSRSDEGDEYWDWLP